MRDHPRPRKLRMRRSKIWISICIVLLIALHAVPVLSASLRKRMWPILDWAMYKDSRGPGPIDAKKKRVIGITSQGLKEEVTADLLGSSPFAMNNLYVVPMFRNDSAAAQRLFQRLNLRRDDPFVELHLESETYTVTDTGVVRQENPVLVYRAPSTPR
jgi:hypothetical protein